MDGYWRNRSTLFSLICRQAEIIGKVARDCICVNIFGLYSIFFGFLKKFLKREISSDGIVFSHKIMVSQPTLIINLMCMRLVL